LQRYEKGMPLYEVHWVGYDDVTWEPPANLVGAAESVREYDTQEKKESSARKAALIAKTAAKRVADAARLTQEQKERAAKAMREAEEMMAGPTEANPTAPGVADSKPKFLQRTDGRIVLRCHARKQADCYDAYDLSLPIPTCMVNSKGEVGGDGLCGQKVDPKNGTTNFWGHLYRHHRKVWLGLKKKGLADPSWRGGARNTRGGLTGKKPERVWEGQSREGTSTVWICSGCCQPTGR